MIQHTIGNKEVKEVEKAKLKGKEGRGDCECMRASSSEPLIHLRLPGVDDWRAPLTSPFTTSCRSFAKKQKKKLNSMSLRLRRKKMLRESVERNGSSGLCWLVM